MTLSIATTTRCRGGRYSFPGSLHFTLDPYLIMLSVKQGGIKYHFLSLWYTKKNFRHGRLCTDSRESRHKTQREKACNLLLPMRTLSPKIIRKRTCGLKKAKTHTYGSSLIYIYIYIYTHTHPCM